jgi:mono/diheme cytochrome c family protein
MTAATLRRARRAAIALALGAGLLLAAGCGGGDAEAPDLDAGKTTFVAKCAVCHTLGASGAPPAHVGPNLDDSFRASREAGIDDEQFAGLVERWIRIAQLPMPRDLVTGPDARNVAAYIASVAGTNPESDVYPATTSPEVPDPPRQEQE